MCKAYPPVPLHVPVHDRHFPCEHDSPDWHFFAQAPQLAVSVRVSTQAPLQVVCPTRQNPVLLPPTDTAVQEPEVQTCPELHFFPQLPQLFLSDFVSTQVPLQVVWPTRQNAVLLPTAEADTSVQEPEVQICPELHEWPQAPQL